MPKAETYDLAHVPAMVHALVNQVSASPLDNADQSPLDLALFLNPVVQTLIERGGRMAPSTQSRLALSAAALLSHDTLRPLALALNLGAARGEKGATAVHQWARVGALENLENWCGDASRPLHALLDHPDVRGETPLCAAVKHGALNSVRWLIDHGARADHLNHQQNTTLHLALGANRQPGLEAMLLLLVEHGAPADQPNRHGVTPLQQQGNARAAPWILAWECLQLQQAAVASSPESAMPRRRL